MKKKSASSAAPIPANAGIGLRFPHHSQVTEGRPAVAWFEVHPENYMAGGAALEALETVRAHYPISFHAVGLSLGSTDGIDTDHLARLGKLIEGIEPGLVSDHLSWSIIDGTYLADLLPLPYTEEALALVSNNIDAVQNALSRKLLVENPSSYLRFSHSTIREAEFLAELVRRTGCGILCDVNNIYVSARNLGLDATSYLNELPISAIGEIHLAGHAVRRFDDGAEICIDDHGSEVTPDVWSLYELALSRFGAVPTLIEWDTNVPSFAVLETEAAKAEALLDATRLGLEGRHARVA